MSMEWDGTPLDEAARDLENTVADELGVRPYAVDETEPGTLLVRYAPIDVTEGAFADAVDEAAEEIEADVRAGTLPARAGRTHERDLVALVSGLRAR